MNPTSLPIFCCVSVLSMILAAAPQQPHSSHDKEYKEEREKFDRLYQELVHLARHGRGQFRRHAFLSSAGSLEDSEEFRQFVGLPRRLVPWMVEKADESRRKTVESVIKGTPVVDYGYDCMAIILEHMVKKRGFRYPETPETLVDIVRWWKSRDEVPAEFEKHYARWKEEKVKVDPKEKLTLITEYWDYDPATKTIKKERTRTPLGKAYAAIRNLGIDALPHLVEKLKQGDDDLLPMFQELVSSFRDEHTSLDPVEMAFYRASSTDPVEQRVKAALAWWEENKKDWLLPPVSAVRFKGEK